MTDTPTRIGPYAIERRLGAGGMAETFVAVRSMQGVEQRVCLKRILPAYARDTTARRLFQREATISARLRHANLVQVLDVGEDNNTPYLVMELVEGADLDHVLEQAPGHRLPADLVAYVLAEIAHGLHEAHGGGGAHEGVVHRDLSPSNVLLSTSGEVKVADFGIAKALSGDKATATMMRGKFAYMAPEQLDGAELDPRADMFALGVIGHQMLAGVRPFEADSDARLVLLIAKNERKPLASLVPDAPRDLVEVIESLLSHRKEERPADGHVIVERLAPVLPSSTLAKRRLGKLTQAAYEARLTSIATDPTAPDVRGGAAAIAPTVLASPRTAEPVSASPLSIPPTSIATAPTAPTASPSTPITSPELAAPSGGRGVMVPIAIAAIAALAVLGTGGGLYVAFGASAEPALASVAPTVAAPVVGSPPSSVVPTPPASAMPTPPSTTVAAAPPTTPPRDAPLPSGVEPPSPVPTTVAHHEHHGGRPTTPPPSAPPPSSTVSVAAREPEPAPEADAHGNGTLHVVVSPWGQVWVDGRFMGRAPIDAPLRAGTHRVAAGFDHPGPERTVRIRAGQTERIELEVDP